MSLKKRRNMNKANVYMIDIACIDTCNKYNSEQTKHALYNYMTSAETNFFTNSKNRTNIATIHPLEVKKAIIESVLISRLYKENSGDKIVFSTEGKEYNKMSPDEMQCTIYELYKKGGVEAVDSFLTIDMTSNYDFGQNYSDLVYKPLNESIRMNKVLDSFISDRYYNQKIGMRCIDNFSETNSEAKEIVQNIENYYNNQIKPQEVNKLY